MLLFAEISTPLERYKACADLTSLSWRFWSFASLFLEVEWSGLLTYQFSLICHWGLPNFHWLFQSVFQLSYSSKCKTSKRTRQCSISDARAQLTNTGNVQRTCDAPSHVNLCLPSSCLPCIINRWHVMFKYACFRPAVAQKSTKSKPRSPYELSDAIRHFSHTFIQMCNALWSLNI